MRLKQRLTWIIAAAVICLMSSGLAAQTLPLAAAKKAAAPARAQANDSDALGRSTPQGAVVGFMISARKGDYERAAKYLDTKKSGKATDRLVDELQAVLERGFSGTSAILSTKLEGRPEKDLPPSKELVGTIETAAGSLDVLLEKVRRGDEPPVWLFASDTLAKIPETYQELNLHSLDRYFPRFMTRQSFLWFPLWQWIYILQALPQSRCSPACHSECACHIPFFFFPIMWYRKPADIRAMKNSTTATEITASESAWESRDFASAAAFACDAIWTADDGEE